VVVPNELTIAQDLFYDHYGSNVTFVENNYVHTWPTDVPESQFAVKDCEVEVPYGRIINCGHDVAGDILNHLYPNIDGSKV